MPAAAKHRVLKRVVLPLTVLVALLVLPAAAGAASENRAQLRLLPSADKRLGVKQVRLISTGLARGRGKAIRLPVVGGKVGESKALLAQGGGIRVKVRAQGRKPRSLRLGRLRLRLGKRSVLTARLPRAKANQPIFVLRHRPRALSLDVTAKTAKLRNARLVPTGRAKRIFRRHLGLKRVRSLPLARLAVSSELTAFDLPEVVPPPLAPLPPEPAKLARPATAVNVAAAQVTWCVRASWIRYIGNGTVSSGASREEPFVVNEEDKSRVCDQRRAEISSGATAYKYFFTFKEGWYDVASQTAALYFTGKVNFNYPERGIDLDFNDPELEINGAATRTIFRIEGRGGTAIAPHRTVFTTNGEPLPALDTSVPGTIRSGELPGFLATDTSAGVFSDFYIPPNHDFGWISVDFTPAP